MCKGRRSSIRTCWMGHWRVILNCVGRNVHCCRWWGVVWWALFILLISVIGTHCNVIQTTDSKKFYNKEQKKTLILIQNFSSLNFRNCKPSIYLHKSQVLCVTSIIVIISLNKQKKTSHFGQKSARPHPENPPCRKKLLKRAQIFSLTFDPTPPHVRERANSNSGQRRIRKPT